MGYHPRDMAGLNLWLYRALVTGLLPAAIPAIWLKDRLRRKARPGLLTRLGGDLPEIEPGGIWIQAVSVGEVELVRRLVDELMEQAPGLPLLLTSTTATGLALARRSLGSRLMVHPCPLDLPLPVNRVLEATRPRLLVLVETELWPEMLYQAAARQVPVAVINARISDDSYKRYLRARRLLAPLLTPVSRVLARSEADLERFASLGIQRDRIAVSGNIKFDLRADQTPLPWQAAVSAAAGERPIVIAGSTMEGEEQAVLDAVEALDGQPGCGSRPGRNGSGRSRLLLILAPRHPERFGAVAQLLRERGVRFWRRSDETPATGAADACDVFLLDTIGELSRAYALSGFAFIGGSLVPTGGHNPLEPAIWGVPVLTGPFVENFREIYDEMIGAGGAIVARDPAELSSCLRRWLEQPAHARKAGRAALEVIERNRGATRRTVEELLRLAGAEPEP